MRKQTPFLLLFLFSFHFLAGISFAARNISISTNKTSLNSEEELMIIASSSGFTNGEKIYLKGAFYKDGSSNYFGYTKKNDFWIKNSTTALSQREIIIGEWDDLLIVKPDYLDSGFLGAGDYKLKVGFYFLTSGGNISAVNWSANDLNITLNSVPTATPVEVKSNSVSSTRNNSSSSSRFPTPTKQPTISQNQYNSNITQISKEDSEFAKITREIRPASEFAKIEPISEEIEVKKEEVIGVKDKNYPPFILLSGISFLLAGGVVFAKNYLKEKVQ